MGIPDLLAYIGQKAIPAELIAMMEQATLIPLCADTGSAKRARVLLN
jgi:hypothetical protein